MPAQRPEASALSMFMRQLKSETRSSFVKIEFDNAVNVKPRYSQVSSQSSMNSLRSRTTSCRWSDPSKQQNATWQTADTEVPLAPRLEKGSPNYPQRRRSSEDIMTGDLGEIDVPSPQQGVIGMQIQGPLPTEASAPLTSSTSMQPNALPDYKAALAAVRQRYAQSKSTNMFNSLPNLPIRRESVDHGIIFDPSIQAILADESLKVDE